MTQQINTGSEPVVVAAPEGHDAAMSKVFDDRNNGIATPAVETKPAATVAERPANIPEKFWDATKGELRTEAMLASYGELEKRVGTPKAAEPVVVDPNKPAVVTPEAAVAKVAEAGLSFESYSTEYAKDGKLSEASYAALATAGIPADVVNDYISGQEAQAEVIRLSVFNEAGGEAEYAKTLAWAAKALSPAEIEAYNAATDSASVETLKLAAAGLRAKYVAANGEDPKLLNGDPAGGASTDVYRSTAELKADMADVKYRTDPAFRADVQAKLGRSSIM